MTALGTGAETPEVELAGGNASGRVVRVGATVRKAWQPTSPRAVAFVARLRAAGLDVPALGGPDEQGRLVCAYVPGRLAIDQAPLDEPLVRRVGRLIRALHDAAADLPVPADWPVLLPAPHPDLICHNDLATWNLVLADRPDGHPGERLVFIDWDSCGPSSRAWDLAWSAISFAHLFPDADVDAAAARLAALVEGYGADADLRRQVGRLLPVRAEAMRRHLERSHARGEQPWAAMYLDGHGEHWRQTAAFVAAHRRRWHRALLAG